MIEGKKALTGFKRIMKGETGLLIILIAICLIFTVSTRTFATVNNLMNITRQVSIVLVISIGMLCVVLTGEIDLSVGSTAALAGVCSAIIMKSSGSIFAGVFAALILAAVLGLAEGMFTVYGRLPSFIVTLAGMWIYRGIALVWTQGRAVSGLPREFAFVGASYLWVIPVSTVLCAILLVIGYYFIHRTKHGVYLKAIGANPEAAILSAIPIRKYKISAFIVSGITAGIGGLITTSRLLSAQAIANEGAEMDVLAAVILGGASLSGGVGSITGTIFGALIIGVINNGMNQLGINSFWQQIVKGSIILIAVLIRRKDKEN